MLFPVSTNTFKQQQQQQKISKFIHKSFLKIIFVLETN